MANTPLRKFRADEPLWEAFSAAVEASPDPEADRAKVLRQLMRWYAGLPGAELPRRAGDAAFQSQRLHHLDGNPRNNDASNLELRDQPDV